MSARKEILIVDKKGRPLASQAVGLYNIAGTIVANATTDEYGMATFASIANGVYRVSGTRGSYTSRNNYDVLVFGSFPLPGITATASSLWKALSDLGLIA